MSSDVAGKNAAEAVRGSRRGWVSSRVRGGVMLLAAVIAAVITGLVSKWIFAPLAAWDAAALVFLVSLWPFVLARMSAAQTEQHATREDPGRAVTDVLVLAASVASLVSVGAILVHASSSKGASQDVAAAVAVGSVALSWFTVHTLFTLRYAQLYYGHVEGGIDYNQHAAPRYVDFAYLAFTIGMTFQVSDTDLRRPEIRATALRHALISYLFGAVILASMINLVAGLGTSSGGGGS